MKVIHRGFVYESVGSYNLQSHLISKYGIELILNEYNNRLEISKIVVPKDSRGSGVGSKVIQEIVDYADANNLTTVLNLADRSAGWGTTSKDRLAQFYKRFGFVRNTGKNSDFNHSFQMYRNPSNSNKNLEVPDNSKNLKGYKIVLFKDGKAYSLADNTVEYPLNVGSKVTGDMYLGTSKEFCTVYYGGNYEEGDEYEELLLTYSYDIKDLVKGNPNDKDQLTGGSEIIVRSAILEHVYNLTLEEDVK